ncbi:hypothetical protein J3E71DRAFT_336176, partial [Bipolaris maydis]
MYTGWHFWFIYVNSFCVYFCFFYSRPSCFGHLRYQCRSLFCLFYHFSDFPFGWQLSFFLVADYNHLSNISYILHNHLDLEKPV